LHGTPPAHSRDGDKARLVFERIRLARPLFNFDTANILLQTKAATPWRGEQVADLWVRCI
jgi:hypothetical protein